MERPQRASAWRRRSVLGAQPLTGIGCDLTGPDPAGGRDAPAGGLSPLPVRPLRLSPAGPRRASVIKKLLKPIQYRQALIDGFLAQTGLTLEPEPP